MRVWVLAAAALTLAAEPGRELGVANVWMKSGIHVKVSARIGGSASLDYGFGVRTTDKSTVYREFMDKKRVVFGYEIEVNRLPDKDRVQVIIKPLGSEYARITGSSEVPTFPAARELPVMWLGDSATIDVLENPSNGQKVTDTIQVDAAPMETVPGGDNRSGIGFSNTRVLIDGNPVGSAAGSGVRGDEIVMFYVPGKGSYFLSREAVPGYKFMKVGVVDGKRLSFVWNNEKHELLSDSDISESREIWVLHDPRKPTARWLQRSEGEFFQAAAQGMQSFYPND
jgi:hypothetical protein